MYVYIAKHLKHTSYLYRYDEFFDPPVILNVQYERCADPQQEKYRNRVTLADLTRENPDNQQVINSLKINITDYKPTRHLQF